MTTNMRYPMLLVTLFLLAACAGEPAAEPTTTTTTTVPPTTTTTEAAVTGPVPVEMLEAMKEDLAERTRVDPSEIGVVEAEAVTWRDGSLGCPEEGMMYTQALVDGYRVLLEAEGETHAYHAAETGQFTYCPEDRAEEPATTDQ